MGRVRDMFGSPKGRTELNIGGSGAKNCAEHHGNVRFGVAPQKPTKNCKKTYIKSNFLAIVKFGKKVDFFARPTKNGRLPKKLILV